MMRREVKEGRQGCVFFFVSGNCAVHAIVCGNLVVVMLEWQFSLVAVVVGVAIWLQWLLGVAAQQTS